MQYPMQGYPQQMPPMQPMPPMQQPFSPSPYMNGPPMNYPQQASGGVPVWLIIVVSIVVIVLLLYIIFPDKFMSVINGALGGVSAAKTEVDKTLEPGKETNVQVGSSDKLNAKQVTTLIFTKDTSKASNNGDNADWRTFQIGEVKVYDTNGRLLTASDFSAAAYSADSDVGWAKSFLAGNAIDGDPNTFTHTGNVDGAIHQLKLVLKQPTNISHIQVLNRADCCSNRLVGVVCDLKAADGALVKTFTLTADQVQDLKVIA